MIAEALAAYAHASNRAFEARVMSVGASEVGRCERAVFFEKNAGDRDYGAPRDGDSVDDWGARVRGSIFEAHFWAPALYDRFGARLRYAGVEQKTLTLGFLSSTPDGLLVGLDRDALAELGVSDMGDDGSLVVEAKTIDPRTKLDGPKPAHAFQAQVQLGLFHALTAHRPEYALLSYTDASFWDLTREFAIRRDGEIFATAQRRAARILTATSAAELRPEGWIAGGKECKRCPYRRACKQFGMADLPTDRREYIRTDERSPAGT
jgi:hypothetical protein